jgi:uncharacterized protein
VPVFLRGTATGVRISLHVQPGASSTGIVGLHGERLKISVTASPTDGRANKAVIDFLSGALGLPRSAIKIVAGETSRQKTLELTGVDLATIIAHPLLHDA